jgi:hypothetical protein
MFLHAVSDACHDSRGGESIPLFSKGNLLVVGCVANSFAYGSCRYPSSTQLTLLPAASWSVPLTALSLTCSWPSLELPVAPRPRASPRSPPPRRLPRRVLRSGISLEEAMIAAGNAPKAIWWGSSNALGRACALAPDACQE